MRLLSVIELFEEKSMTWVLLIRPVEDETSWLSDSRSWNRLATSAALLEVRRPLESQFDNPLFPVETRVCLLNYDKPCINILRHLIRSPKCYIWICAFVESVFSSIITNSYTVV